MRRSQTSSRPRSPNGLVLFGLVALSAVPSLAAQTLHLRAEQNHLVAWVEGATDNSWLAVERVIGDPDVDAPPRADRLVEGLGAKETKFPRFIDGRDRLYGRFQLFDVKTSKTVGSPRWVVDLSAIDRKFSLPTAASKKGVQSIVDPADAIALGIKHAAHNVTIGSLALPMGSSSPLTRTVDGEAVPLNKGTFDSLTEQFKRFTDAGALNYIILLNVVPQEFDPANPLIHLKTDLKAAPNRLGAFNLANARGYRWYRAAIEELADRACDPSGKYGRVAGIIIGNELQSHWQWTNMGEASAEEVIREYHLALRIADIACRRYHDGLRAYASFDHHWTMRPDANPRRCLSGKVLMDGLIRVSQAEGDFPWGVAFHPYPDNLFEPRFWTDTRVSLRFDTPKITFKNLEVLPAYLDQPTTRVGGPQGPPRKIILSEQGFHCPDGPEGEKTQAAALAYGYERVKRMPGIDALILQRHVDHEAEGGLRLGLWTVKKGSIYLPERKRFGWDVYQAVDGPNAESAEAFALPMVGLKSWDQASPATVDTTEEELIDASIVLDLTESLLDAKRTNLADWRPEVFPLGAGRFAPSIFTHPSPRGEGGATYALKLPKVAAGEELALVYGCAVTAPTRDGMTFRVRIQTELAGEETIKTKGFVWREAPLTRWAGQPVMLALSVDPIADSSHDWALWLWPRVVRRPVKADTGAAKETP